MQGAHLVVHERNERRDHQGRAVAGALARNGGHLVAQAFAPASGHEHQGVAAAKYVLDDLGLRAAKGIKAKDFAQDGGKKCYQKKSCSVSRGVARSH
jgi:hypothetical protein